jgi:hypothetical protein
LQLGHLLCEDTHLSLPPLRMVWLYWEINNNLIISKDYLAIVVPGRANRRHHRRLSSRQRKHIEVARKKPFCLVNLGSSRLTPFNQRAYAAKPGHELRDFPLPPLYDEGDPSITDGATSAVISAPPYLSSEAYRHSPSFFMQVENILCRQGCRPLCRSVRSLLHATESRAIIYLKDITTLWLHGKAVRSASKPC